MQSQHLFVVFEGNLSPRRKIFLRTPVRLSVSSRWSKSPHPSEEIHGN